MALARKRMEWRAAQLGISIDAAKSRLHRARALLRDHLPADGYLASVS